MKILFQSNNFCESSWCTLASPPNISISSTLAPDGTLTAQRIDFPTTDSRLQTAIDIPVSQNRKYLFSVYVKPARQSPIVLRLRFHDGEQQISPNFIVENEEWSFISFEIVAQFSTSYGRFQIGNSTQGTAVSCYLWGAQVLEITKDADDLMESPETLPKLYVSSKSIQKHSSPIILSPSDLRAPKTISQVLPDQMHHTDHSIVQNKDFFESKREQFLAHWTLTVTEFLEGKPLNFSDEMTDFPLENRDINEINDRISQNLSGLNFQFDESLDIVSCIKDYSFSVPRYLPDNVAHYILGEHIHSSWMIAQLCSISAIINGKFEFEDFSKIQSSKFYSEFTWPCLIERDNRLVIPVSCEHTGERLFVVCDEYWGFPSAVVDFKNKLIFSTESSPITRGPDYTRSITMIARNIIAWIYYTSKFSKHQHPAKRYLFTGGTVNPSHIIWNFLGGANLLNKIRRFYKVDYDIIQTSDLLFESDKIFDNIINVSSLSPIRQVEYLCANGMSHATAIRLTDNGINPHFCEDLCGNFIARRMRHEYSSTLSEKPFRQYFQDMGFSKCRIGITVRAGRRKVLDQVGFLVEVIKGLTDALEQVTIIFDGSATGNMASIKIENDIATQVSRRFRTEHPDLQAKVDFQSAIGLTIEEQVLIYKDLDSYLTYTSGGNAKFIGFNKRIGVVIGPDSEEIAHAKKSLSDVIANSRVMAELAQIVFLSEDVFVVSHDYTGYAHELSPDLLCLGDPVSKTNSNTIDGTPKSSFHNDFRMDSSYVIAALKKSLFYSAAISKKYKAKSILNEKDALDDTM
jgi:hypothetical protein